MDLDKIVRRAQAYAFFSEALLYPTENWTDEAAVLSQILTELEAPAPDLPMIDLPDLQASHRRTFGAAGSLCYETEYGLPHEYRQSQELADLNGFYRAFGFSTGGAVRERPDHVAVELEFMYVLNLKEALAGKDHGPEQRALCRDAQKKFLADHLGRWIDLFARSVALQGQPPYPMVTRSAADFVRMDAKRLGADLSPLQLAEVRPTPFDPDFSCAGCQCEPAPAQSPGGAG